MGRLTDFRVHAGVITTLTRILTVTMQINLFFVGVELFTDFYNEQAHVLRPSKFEGHCPMIRHGCRMALMVALNWSVECVKEES